MKRRLHLILCAVLIAGCLNQAPAPEKAAPQTVWSVAADKIDAGHWDRTQTACKDITHVAKQANVEFPDGYNEFWKPLIVKNVPLDSTNRPVISKKLREWSK